MAKLTKFKAQQVEFGTHYKIEETNRGDTKIKSITPAFGNIREPGTPETEEIYNGLQLGNVHTLQAIKSTNLNIDYYICNLDGLTEFGLNNDLKLRITVDNANTNATTKLRLNNVDYTLLKEQNGTLKQIEAGDIHLNKTYELIYNGSQFVVINLFKNFESSYLDNCIKKTDYATENKAGIVTLGTTANTALEGKRLAEIIGIEFGGKIQDSGIKTAGKFYYDTVTKFYYECIANNNLTYNDSSKFRAISNKPISDRVENLFKITEYKTISLQNTQKGSATGYSVGNIAVFNFHDVKPTSRNGNAIVARLPVVPLIPIETAATAINEENSIRVSVDREGAVRIISGGTLPEILKEYTFSITFPFAI